MVSALAWVKAEEVSNNEAKFIVSPLDRGMGNTLGNSLRRVLLSSIGGYALTSLSIEGVKHEFSPIANVVEDVVDVVANLKSVIFRVEGEDVQNITLSVSKKGKVLAKDIKTSSEVTILNPEQYIAEFSDKGQLKLEAEIRQGIGYESVEMRPDLDESIFQISLDASYSPVIRVNHSVENIRVGKDLNHDALTLDVVTDGSVTPEEAVVKASSILCDKFDLFQRINQEPDSPVDDEQEENNDAVKAQVLSMSIDDLELSARSSNCLKRAGIETLSELVEKDLSELIQIKNFGKKSADEINEKLQQYSLELRDNSSQLHAEVEQV